jgi:hypothetical protein
MGVQRKRADFSSTIINCAVLRVVDKPGISPMSDVIERAKAKLAQMEQQAEFLRKFITDSERVQRILEPGQFEIFPTDQPNRFHVVPGTADDSVSESGDRTITFPAGHPMPAPPRTRVRDNPKPAVLIPAVVEILRARGQPMSRRQLHEALTERDLVVRGAEPTKTLGTILWRARDVIDSIDGRGYWPKGDPVPVPSDLTDLI